MRLIGSIQDELQVNRFAAFLVGEGIQTKLEHEDGQWEVWVRDEDYVRQASMELNKFRENPNDRVYELALELEISKKRLEEEEAKKRAEAKNQPETSTEVVHIPRRQPLTIILMAMCLVIFGWTKLGPPAKSYVEGKLKFANTNGSLDTTKDFQEIGTRFRDIRSGEVWRLFTPNLMHADLLHIGLNLLGLVYLGGQIEHFRGTWKFGLLVLFIGIVANVVQALFVGINFLGISGVVYGAVGYLWIKSTFDPKSGMYISDFLIILSIVWLLAGFSQVIPNQNLANWAHLGGLVAGVLAALVPLLLKRPSKDIESEPN